MNPISAFGWQPAIISRLFDFKRHRDTSRGHGLAALAAQLVGALVGWLAPMSVHTGVWYGAAAAVFFYGGRELGAFYLDRKQYRLDRDVRAWQKRKWGSGLDFLWPLAVATPALTWSIHWSEWWVAVCVIAFAAALLYEDMDPWPDLVVDGMR